ncbi:uncharacterized protein BDV17DRAFT_270014 [Aspergillus undulatus]|uniref:uncharacterized protein n=1 Tax=Aspergillus undulatus TaxID=1810928 RepID=UPI003CCCF3EB
MARSTGSKVILSYQPLIQLCGRPRSKCFNDTMPKREPLPFANVFCTKKGNPITLAPRPRKRRHERSQLGLPKYFRPDCPHFADNGPLVLRDGNGVNWYVFRF